MIRAKYVKNLLGFTGDARLFSLNEPIAYGNDKHTDHVVVSAVVAYGSGPETYIFPADAEGSVLSWCELDGSYRGGLDHEEAIRQAGWEVEP
jgi:hypothetical protein